MGEYKNLEVKDRGKVRVLTLNRPAKKNAFNIPQAVDLRAGLAEAAEDDDVGVVVVTGAGDAFSSGADMQMFASLGKGDAGDVTAVAMMDETIRAFPKVCIAAVNGVAVGMGVTMLACFDMVYASDNATFLTPFVRLGLVMELGSSFSLTRLLGRQRTNELILRAQPIDAQTALQWGLVNRVFSRESLLEEVLAIATDVANNAPNGVRHCKGLIVHGETAGLAESKYKEAEILGKCYGSKEHMAAVMAFLAKRQAAKAKS